MSQILIKDVVDALEDVFPPHYQEHYDNTGLQVGDVKSACNGVLLCVDVTSEIVAEAVAKGCNLIVTHHPLIFTPIKSVVPDDRVGGVIVSAIKEGVAIYSCHTSADNTPINGVSWRMAEMLGLQNVSTLEPKNEEGVGSGIVGELRESLSRDAFVAQVREAFGSPVARCSSLTPDKGSIKVVALCGGAGGFLLPTAIDRGADAFIASDCKHNQFIDNVKSIFLIDIGHFESEECTKQIFYQIIRKKFPNFALYCSEQEKNPIIYL